MKKFYPLFILSLLACAPFVSYTISRSWYQKAPIGGDARHRCTGFSIGNKGYIGGGHINSGVVITYKDYWEYDPATNSWTQIADYGGGFRYHSSAFTIGNAAYVGCGENSTHEYTKDFWKYVPEVNTWFPIADLPGIERRGGVAFTINGKGYFGTGQSDEGYQTDFYVYDPETNSWSSVADFPGEPRSAAVSFAYTDKGYVGTGHMVGAAMNDFYEYNPALDEWTTKASVGGSIRQDATAFCIDGKGYIGLGNDNLGNDFGDIWEYDFAADTWTQIEDFSGLKRRYAVAFDIDNIVYLGSGTDGTNMKDFWAYAPTVSIIENELSDLEVTAYPNPSTDIITIQSTLPEVHLNNITYAVSNINGKTYREEKITSNTLVLNKQDFGTGQFFLQFSYNGVPLLTKKLLFN